MERVSHRQQIFTAIEQKLDNKIYQLNLCGSSYGDVEKYALLHELKKSMKFFSEERKFGDYLNENRSFTVTQDISKHHFSLTQTNVSSLILTIGVSRLKIYQ